MSDATMSKSGEASECGCEQARANLYDLLRGELCAEESAPIRAHIETCPSCRDERSVCESLTDVVRRACEEERAELCPKELRAKISTALENSQRA